MPPAIRVTPDRVATHAIHAWAPALRHWLPAGDGLPDQAWRQRHRGLLLLLWLHVVIFAIGARLVESQAGVTLLGIGLMVLCGGLASLSSLPRAWRAALVSLGLVSSSIVLIHLWNGHIQAHFHIFLVLALVSLYQHWLPFLVVIGTSVAYHSVAVMIAPASIYNHPDAWTQPWRWALIHAAFVLVASIVSVISWRLHEAANRDLASEIAERKNLEDRLIHQAFHDPLTTLANRALFEDRLAHALARGARHPAALAILFLDLDEFKRVNDSLGHGAGDQLLVVVAKRLGACLRPSDTIARFGGDEFAILLEDLSGQPEAARVAQRIIVALRAPVRLEGAEVTPSASIGIVLSHNGEESPTTLLRNADIAMYSAKHQGRDGFVFYAPHMHVAARDRLQLEADLNRAVTYQEFHLVYQPIVDLRTNQMIGVEALLRWRHPQRGLLLPGAFMPLAEETGLILPIGRWLLTRACHQLGQWQRRILDQPPLALNLNLSARQLQDSALVADVTRAIQQSGCDPHSLTLEITESVMMHDTEATIETLRALKALGIRIALDDFGTGYSSLSYLQRFPVDSLKIDRYFTATVTEATQAANLARTIISLGRVLRLDIIAEGIETRAQLARLRGLGCERGQGFYFAPAIEPARIDAILGKKMVPSGW